MGSVKNWSVTLAVCSALAVAAGGRAAAQDGGGEAIELPRIIAWSAYDTGSAGHAHSIAIGNVLRNKHGTTIRVLPGRNDISRMTPLKNQTVDYCLCGVAAYFANEGVDLFATSDWGPQKLRTVLQAVGDYGVGYATAADAGITSVEDIAGKRVARVAASPAVNLPVDALLAFAGLTWDDVRPVEFSGYVDTLRGIVEDRVDVAFALTTTTVTYQIEASPRGLVWPPLPHDNTEGWQRFLEIAPYIRQHAATEGPGLSPEHPVEMATYPYPILITETDQDADEVYNLVRALDEGYGEYKDAAPGASAYGLDRQILQWVIPWSEGSIRYFTEKGMWSEAAQAHQDDLVKRQEVLHEAWESYTADAPDDEDAFKTGWIEARASALEAAGLDPVFR